MPDTTAPPPADSAADGDAQASVAWTPDSELDSSVGSEPAPPASTGSLAAESAPPQSLEQAPAPAPTPAPSPAPAATAGEGDLWSDSKPTREEELLARTRASQTWVGIIVFAIILILLLIFVLENTERVPITYFGASTSLPLAVAMLLSAVAGVLLTAIAGTLRILQLRRRLRKTQRR